MIVFDEQIFQLPSQHNHVDIEHLEIIHVFLMLCVALHHSDLCQVSVHVVDERPTFGWLLCRNWYENQKFFSPSSLALFW